MGGVKRKAYKYVAPRCHFSQYAPVADGLGQNIIFERIRTDDH